MLKLIRLTWAAIWHRPSRRVVALSWRSYLHRSRLRQRIRQAKEASQPLNASLERAAARRFDGRDGSCASCGQPSLTRQCYQCEDAVPAPYSEVTREVEIAPEDRLCAGR